MYKRFRSLGELLLSMVETEFPVVRCHETYIDIVLLPEVKKVLHVHYKREISNPEWKKLRRVIPAAFSRWRRTVDSQLTKSFAELAPVFKKSRTLDHPATVFGCKEPLCRKTSCGVAYADLISHPCCHTPHSLAKVSASFGGSVYNHAAQSHFGCWPWSANTLTTHEASDKVGVVMAACGADPNTTSWKQMDEQDVRLSCKRCYERGISMGWRTAVSIMFPNV